MASAIFAGAIFIPISKSLLKIEFPLLERRIQVSLHFQTIGGVNYFSGRSNHKCVMNK